MSESLLIQVDEVTKSMLETIEERIFEGTRTAQESGFKNFSDSMDEVQKNLQRSMDSVNKQLKQTNEQIEPLQTDIQRVGRLVQEGAIISKDFSVSMDQFQKNLQRSLDLVNEQIKQTTDQIEPLHTDIQGVSRLVQEGGIITLERVKEVQNTLLQLIPTMGQRMEKQMEQQREQFHQLRSAQQVQAVQNEELLQLCTLLVTKMEALEAEVKWLRQPIWKRLFGGRK